MLSSITKIINEIVPSKITGCKSQDQFQCRCAIKASEACSKNHSDVQMPTHLLLRAIASNGECHFCSFGIFNNLGAINNTANTQVPIIAASRSPSCWSIRARMQTNKNNVPLILDSIKISLFLLIRSHYRTKLINLCYDISAF